MVGKAVKLQQIVISNCARSNLGKYDATDVRYKRTAVCSQKVHERFNTFQRIITYDYLGTHIQFKSLAQTHSLLNNASLFQTARSLRGMQVSRY
jgi:type IV secretory pathway component VirB8